MTALKFKGYKEHTVELKLHIINSFNKYGNVETRVVDISSGITYCFNNIDDVLNSNICDNEHIEVVNLPHLYGYLDEPELERTRIILIQQIEDCERVI